MNGNKLLHLMHAVEFCDISQQGTLDTAMCMRHVVLASVIRSRAPAAHSESPRHACSMVRTGLVKNWMYE